MFSEIFQTVMEWSKGNIPLPLPPAAYLSPRSSLLFHTTGLAGVHLSPLTSDTPTTSFHEQHFWFA